MKTSTLKPSRARFNLLTATAVTGALVASQLAFVGAAQAAPVGPTVITTCSEESLVNALANAVDGSVISFDVEEVIETVATEADCVIEVTGVLEVDAPNVTLRNDSSTKSLTLHRDFGNPQPVSSSNVSDAPILLIKGSGSFSLTNIIIDGNKTSNYTGRAIEVYEDSYTSTINITDSSIINNSVVDLDVSHGSGAAIFSAHPGLTVNVNNSNISDNNAAGIGAAIVAGSVSISNGSTFVRNVSEADGDSFTFQAGGAVTALNDVSVSNSDFIANQIQNGVGGAIGTPGQVTTDVNSLFDGNMASNGGGAIASMNFGVSTPLPTSGGQNYCQSFGPLSGNDDEDYNESDGYNWLSDPNCYITDGKSVAIDAFTRTTFVNNSAGNVMAPASYSTGSYSGPVSGGAYLTDGPATVSYSTFETNASEAGGGAILSNDVLDLVNNTFYMNRTTVSGAQGAAVSVADATSARSHFINNTFWNNSGLNVSETTLHSASDLTALANIIGSSDSAQPVTTYNTLLCDVKGSDLSSNVNWMFNQVTDDSCGGAIKTESELKFGSYGLNGSADEQKTLALTFGSSAIDIFSVSDTSGAEIGSAVVPVDDERKELRGVTGPDEATIDAGPKHDVGAFEYEYDSAEVTTGSASSVTPDGASLNGSVTPNSNGPVTVGFVYLPSGSENVDDACTDALKAALPGVVVTPSVSGNTSTPVTASIIGLSPNTSYSYCAYVTTTAGTVWGKVVRFTTSPAPIAPALELDLVLNTNLGVQGAGATVGGSGLKPGTQAELWMASTPTLIGTWEVQGDGTFTGEFRFSTCSETGDHTFTLYGTGANEQPLSDQAYFVITPDCQLAAGSALVLQKATLKAKPVLFPNRSAKLSAKYKAYLRQWIPLLKGASVVKVTGFTETDQKTKAAIKYCVGLSERRAKAVQKYLKSQGVKVKWILIGKGATHPTGKAQPKNRRATMEFEVTYGR